MNPLDFLRRIEKLAARDGRRIEELLEEILADLEHRPATYKAPVGVTFQATHQVR